MLAPTNMASVTEEAPCRQSVFYLFLLDLSKHMYRKKRLCLQGAEEGSILDFKYETVKKIFV